MVNSEFYLHFYLVYNIFKALSRKNLTLAFLFSIILTTKTENSRKIQMLFIVDQNTATGTSLALSFSYMGILARAVQPKDAKREFSALYRAVLVRSPELLPDGYSFAKDLRTYTFAIPLFCVGDIPEEQRSLFTAVFPADTTASEIASGIIKASEFLGYEPVGEYTLSGIDASCTHSEVSYYFNSVKLTPKENMILRFLIRAYPTGQYSKDILKYAFSPSRTPEPSAVRTHISSINKKFEKFCDKRLIQTLDSGGYVILTPEMAEKKSALLVE